MSATSEQLQNVPMGLSVALNVVLALGILALLPAPEVPSSGSRLCRGTPTVVTAAEVAHAGKVIYAAPVGGELAGQIMRKTAPPVTTGSIPPVVSYIRCLPS